MTGSIKSLAYYATIQHAQSMLGTDGQYLKMIGRDRSEEAAINMFHTYNVARKIWGNKGIEKLVRTVFCFDKKVSWPDSLVGRVAWCECIVEKADRPYAKNKPGSKVVGKKQGKPYSAVSKMCWFLHPYGWTMFDKYAQKGLSEKTDFSNFYTELNRLNFSEKAKVLNKIIQDGDLRCLYGERIIDKFLMLRGNFWSMEPEPGDAWLKFTQNQLDHFLVNLAYTHSSGRTLSCALKDLARGIAECLPTDSFETAYVKRKLAGRALD